VTTNRDRVGETFSLVNHTSRLLSTKSINSRPPKGPFIASPSKWQAQIAKVLALASPIQFPLTIADL